MHQFFICVIFIPGVQKIIYMIKHLRKLSYKIYTGVYIALMPAYMYKGLRIVISFMSLYMNLFPFPRCKEDPAGTNGQLHQGVRQEEEPDPAVTGQYYLYLPVGPHLWCCPSPQLLLN